MLTIAWDIDDVLNDLLKQWFDQKWLPEHSSCTIKFDSLAENPPHGILGVGLDEYLASLDAYRTSPLYQRLEPVKETHEWFARHGDAFRHIALTATPLIAAPASSHWVLAHFGRWIRTFHVVPSGRRNMVVPEYDGDKASFLRWISKVDVLIDDSPQNVSDAERAGVKGILMPRPWNNCSMTVTDMLSILLDMA